MLFRSKIIKKIEVGIDRFSTDDIESYFTIDSHTISNKIFSNSPILKIENQNPVYLSKNKKIKLDGYTPEGYIEYVFKVKNEGLGILKDFEYNLDFENIAAFSSFEKEVLKDQSDVTVIKNIDGIEKLDIAPKGFVEYKILAKIKKESVEDIEVNGVISKMASADIVHTFSASRDTYRAGETIKYVAILKNKGYGTAYNIPYELNVDKARVRRSGMEDRVVNPFKNRQKIERIPIIYPGEEIKIVYEGETKNSIIDSIHVKSSYGEDIKENIVKSLPGKLEFTSILKSINGKLYTKSSKYKPGDKVTYEIALKNIGEGFLSGLNIENNLENIKSFVSGSDKKESILEGIVIDVKSSDPRSVITPQMGDTTTFIKKKIDFAPKSTIVFEVSGTISERASGTLSGNSFKINDISKTSEEVGSISSSISGEKTLLEPQNGMYKPGDKLKYMLTIKNSGEGYGRGVQIEDIISEVTTEKENKRYGKAFSNWKVTYLGAKDNSSKFRKYTYLKKEISGREDLSTKVDIGPGVSIDFLIEADIDENAIGEIESKATIAGGTSDTQTIYLRPAADHNTENTNESGIRVKASATKSEIKLGEVVGINISVENRGRENYKDLDLKNIIPKGFRYLDEEDLRISLKSEESYSKTIYLKATVGANIGKNISKVFVVKDMENISNTAEAVINVSGDSILNTATIIGKVVDEKTGVGVPKVILYTTDGTVVETDEFGRYHLPDQWVSKAFGENFSVKIDENSLQKGFKVVGQNPVVKRISPYSLTKFNFKIKKDENFVEEPEKEYKYEGTGLFDAYIGNNMDKPRARYFGKGEYKDYKLTLHFDTKNTKEETLLERVTDDDYMYYTTYGDDSKIRKEANTNGKLYLKLEHKESYILWGNYNTDFNDTRFMNYNREFYGLKGEYKDSDINIKAFLSSPDTMYGHDEFLGTGGSISFFPN